MESYISRRARETYSTELSSEMMTGMVSANAVKYEVSLTVRATHTYIRDFLILVILIIISTAFYDVSTFVFHIHSSLGHSPFVFSSPQPSAPASFLTGPINELRGFPAGLFIILSIINTVQPLQTSEYVSYRILLLHSNGIPGFFKLLGFLKI